MTCSVVLTNTDNVYEVSY